MISGLYQDYMKDDYRAFVFATHPKYGFLLLYCDRKKNKPPHFQAPGGHVDEADFLQHKNSHEGIALLAMACKTGAAREIFEETGIDVRSKLDRLQPVRLHGNSKKGLLSCEFKKRLFFKLCLEDRDFVTSGIKSKVSMGLHLSMNENPPPLMLKLSHEHQGFTFEPDATKSVGMLVHHSGGKVSNALRKAIEQDEIKSVENKVDGTIDNIATKED